MLIIALQPYLTFKTNGFSVIDSADLLIEDFLAISA
jgi:hypothetical protein